MRPFQVRAHDFIALDHSTAIKEDASHFAFTSALDFGIKELSVEL
jgi:hypothetical protein